MPCERWHFRHGDISGTVAGEAWGTAVLFTGKSLLSGFTGKSLLSGPAVIPERQPLSGRVPAGCLDV